MAEGVKEGDKVSVHYTGKLEDGTVFDSSEGRDPLTFTAGSGQVIKGFDESVMGKTVGEKFEISIPVQEAYGERSDQLVRTFNKSEFGENLPEEGNQVVFTTQDGQNVPGIVLEVNEENVVVDLNHPLAGKSLVFEIEVVSVE